MRQKGVSIILPALNEEEAVGRVIDEIPKKDMENRGYRVEILVVDNGSTDRTAEIAEQRGVTVIPEPTRGKGRAVRTGIEAASGNFIFMLDADYTYPATYVPQMAEALDEGHDVVLGSRLKGHREEGAMTKLNFVGNHLLAFMANILYGTRISDLCSGCWGFKKEVIETMEIDALGFDLEANIFTELAKKGYVIREIPIHYRRRIAPPKLSSVRDGLKIGWVLIRKRFR